VHLFPDAYNNGEFYIMGTIDTMGGILKPLRVSGQVEWYASFTYLTSNTAYSLIDGQEHIVGCGYYSGTTFSDPTAGFYRISNEGALQWFVTMQPDSGKSNKCYGIAYNSTLNFVYIFLQTTATSLSYGTYYDNAILVFDNMGNLRSGKIISMEANIQYKLDNQFFIPYNNFTYFFFGGEISGFTTDLQSVNFTSSKLNVFAMKYMYANKPNQYSCLIEESVDISSAQPSSGASTTVKNAGNTITFQPTSSSVNFYSSLAVSTQTNIYAVYSSPYSGAFSLLDTMYIPKPCAYISENLT
jgi:hypothetical protein